MIYTLSRGNVSKENSNAPPMYLNNSNSSKMSPVETEDTLIKEENFFQTGHVILLYS